MERERGWTTIRQPPLVSRACIERFRRERDFSSSATETQDGTVWNGQGEERTSLLSLRHPRSDAAWCSRSPPQDISTVKAQSLSTGSISAQAYSRDARIYITTHTYMYMYWKIFQRASADF